jgi:hypothetical protein
MKTIAIQIRQIIIDLKITSKFLKFFEIFKIYSIYTGSYFLQNLFFYY